MFDGKAFGEEMVDIVRGFVEKATAPLLSRIGELETELATVKTVDHGETITAAVAKAVAALPVPKDGTDGRDGVDGKDGAPGEKGDPGADGKDGSDGKEGATGKAGQDGAGLADAVIDRDGSLVLTFTDGRTKGLGLVVGKDGRDGEAGHAGKDGADGVGFDDLDLVETEDGLALRFVRGETSKEFALPVIIDRGVFKEGGSYRKGNGVTWGGSFWIAQKDAPEGKPDAPDSGWRLAVKRGQNGKDSTK